MVNTYKGRQLLLLNLIYYLRKELVSFTERVQDPLTILDAHPEDILEKLESGEYKLPFIVTDFDSGDASNYELGNFKNSHEMNRGYEVHVFADTRSDRLMLADITEASILKGWGVYDINQYDYSNGIPTYPVTNDGTATGTELPLLYTASPDNYQINKGDGTGVARHHDILTFTVLSYENYS